jgi:hypothetical protein
MSAAKKHALNELWRRGDLNYQLHKKQKEIKKDLLSQKTKISVILCARRFGKTYVLLNMAIELCINKPNAIVKYISPQLKQGKQNIKENMPILLKGCPIAMKPEWKENDKKYIFPNGSEIQIAGTDNGSHESLRGGRADMCIVDEAGFCDHLDYVIKSILRPTTLTTKGKIYLVSTPSKTYTHEFIQLYVKPAQAANKIKTYTIHDNPMITQEDIDELLQDYIGGEDNLDFQREYLCKIVNSSKRVVVEEFGKYKKELVAALVQPSYYDAYTSGDVGFRDLTAYLFAYWDYLNATIVIEDELIIREPTTDEIAKGIKEKEQNLFRDASNTPLPIYMRVMDNELIMINDLQLLHNLTFVATRKDNKEAQINQLKIMVKNKQIKINPKCRHLIYHLENAMWDKNRQKFEHLPDYIDTANPENNIWGGHADALDALIYLVRNIVKTKNPYPEGWGKLAGQNIFQTRMPQQDQGVMEQYKEMLNIRKK